MSFIRGFVWHKILCKLLSFNDHTPHGAVSRHSGKSRGRLSQLCFDVIGPSLAQAKWMMLDRVIFPSECARQKDWSFIGIAVASFQPCGELEVGTTAGCDVVNPLFQGASSFTTIIRMMVMAVTLGISSLWLNTPCNACMSLLQDRTQSRLPGLSFIRQPALALLVFPAVAHNSTTWQLRLTIHWCSDLLMWMAACYVFSSPLLEKSRSEQKLGHPSQVREGWGPVRIMMESVSLWSFRLMSETRDSREGWSTRFHFKVLSEHWQEPEICTSIFSSVKQEKNGNTTLKDK